MSILQTIGETRLTPLRHLVPAGAAEVRVKLEYENPTGSMKDRFVLSYRLFEKMFSKAEFPSDGRLSFVFLPDGKRLLMTFGNRLIEWNYAP